MKCRALCLAIVVAALCCSPLARAQEENYDDLIAKSDYLIRQGEYVQALDAAQAAVAKDPSIFDGFYYEAYAFFKLGRLDEASAAADKAGNISQRQELVKLRASIADGQKFVRYYTDGDAKWAASNFSAACKSYAVAFWFPPASHFQDGITISEKCQDKGFTVYSAYLLWGLSQSAPNEEEKNTVHAILSHNYSGYDDLAFRDTEAGWKAIGFGASKFCPSRNASDAPTLVDNCSTTLQANDVSEDDVKYAQMCFQNAIMLLPLAKQGERVDGLLEDSPWLGYSLTFVEQRNISMAEIILRLAAIRGLTLTSSSNPLGRAAWAPATSNSHFIEFIRNVFGSAAAEKAASPNAQVGIVMAGAPHFREPCQNGT